MTSRWRQREARRASTWRQSLLFNSLLLLFPVFAAEIVTEAFSADLASQVNSPDAQLETRTEIRKALGDLIPDTVDPRTAWAGRVKETLAEGDFAAARGYLLAAPYMLDEQKARSVLAAADSEGAGTQEQRHARAALIFLPDDVRAAYQRAVTPPSARTSSSPDPAPEAGPAADTPTEAPADATISAAAATDIPPDDTPAAIPERARRDPLKTRRTMSLLGETDDLTRQSQNWLAGEPVDTLTLRLRGLGLVLKADRSAKAADFAAAASVLTAGHRANRLEERFSAYLRSRIEDALPEAPLRQRLTGVLETTRTMQGYAGPVLSAFRDSIDPSALQRLLRDMDTIARISERVSPAGALSLLDHVATPDDMRRAKLVTLAGGELSVALSREIGRDALDLAQIGVKWTLLLTLQVMALAGFGMAIFWTTLSAFSQAQTLRLHARRG